MAMSTTTTTTTTNTMKQITNTIVGQGECITTASSWNRRGGLVGLPDLLLNDTFSSLMMMGQEDAPQGQGQGQAIRSHPHPHRHPPVRTNDDVCHILDDVEALLLGEDDDDDEGATTCGPTIPSLSSSSLVSNIELQNNIMMMEPTPIEPNKSQIVDQVHVTENKWHDDETILQMLSPLLLLKAGPPTNTNKRMLVDQPQEDDDDDDDDDDDSSSSMDRPTKKKKMRMTATTSVTTTATSSSNDNTKNKDNNTKNNNRFRSYQSEQWMERYQDLIVYRNEYGHVLVPHILPSNPPLAQWVKRQRYQYKLLSSGKHSTLTNERVTMLETLGFVWDSHRAAWEGRLNELRVFKLKYGHTNVPTTTTTNTTYTTLAVWMKCQRRQRRLYDKSVPSNMNQERIEKLDTLGFVWNPRTTTSSTTN